MDEKKTFAEKHAELVEFLRNDLPEGAKRLIVEFPKLLEYKDESGRLPVHWAASGGCLPFVELCVNQNSQLVTEVDDSGFTPLMIAVSANRLDVARFLLGKAECDVNHENYTGQRSLHYSCSKNNKPMTKLLLEQGAKVNVQDKYGNSPLHRAASLGHHEIVNLLLNAKQNLRLDMRDGEGNTALHMSVEDQNVTMALLLIRNGADPTLKNADEKTPLDYCGTADIRKKLLDAVESRNS